MTLSLARIALAELGSLMCRLFPMRNADRARVHRELFQTSPAAGAAQDDRPAEVSAGPTTTAPSAGQLFRTPPGAVDDPAAVPPRPAAGSPPLDEFDWQLWVIPAISDALADHVATQLWLGHSGAIFCAHADGTPCADFEDMQEWRDHMSPLVAERIHSAAANFGLRCKRCGQPIELHTGMSHVEGIGDQLVAVYLHCVSGDHQCVDRPGQPRTYAAPE